MCVREIPGEKKGYGQYLARVHITLEHQWYSTGANVPEHMQASIEVANRSVLLLPVIIAQLSK